MASTPPPMPSSDEGEFDDDDDFGCFASSRPIDAGVDTESDNDEQIIQHIHMQDDTTTDLVHNVEPSVSIQLSDDCSKSANLTFKGNQMERDQSLTFQDSSNASITTEQVTTFQDNSDNTVGKDPCSGVNTASEDNDVSSTFDVDFERNSFPSTITPEDLSDSHSHGNASEGEQMPESCQGKEEIYGDVKGIESPEQEMDDWADFSSAPCDMTPQEENIKEETENIKEETADSIERESPQLSEHNESSGNDMIPQAIGDDCTSQNEALDSGNIESDNDVGQPNMYKCEFPIDNLSPHQDSGDDSKSRSDDDDLVEKVKPDTDNVSETEDDNDVICVSNDNPDSLDNFNHTKPVSSASDNDGDDNDEDDFGDFSNFTSHKEKESFSEEDVAPISFRTSICEDDLKGDDESSVVFDTDKDAFDSGNNEADKSPVPYDDDEDKNEDWGFKTGEDPPNTKEEDEFGDFGSDNNVPSDGADWADFSESAAPKTTAATDEFDDFDEEEFQSPAPSLPSQLSNQAGLSKVEIAISSSFPHDHEINFFQRVSEEVRCNQAGTESEGGAVEVDGMNSLDSVMEMGLKALPSAKDETWTITKEIRIKDPMVGMWERLKDVDASHALDFGWGSSQCSQEVYSTLHIDTKNVLFSQKKQAVPFFASGLGILEPIRGSSSQPEKQNAPPPLLDTAKPEESQKQVLQDIPPVDFDWSSSGLTDPLKVFKSDTFNSSLSSFEPFAEILQKSAAASQTQPDKELSPEAVGILKKIPKLSFMRSKVLMFPIKDP